MRQLEILAESTAGDLLWRRPVVGPCLIRLGSSILRVLAALPTRPCAAQRIKGATMPRVSVGSGARGLCHLSPPEERTSRRLAANDCVAGCPAAATERYG